MSSIIGFNQYDVLPGHKVGFKDKQVKLPRDSAPKVTESVVFLGTATDGPVLEPIQVTSDNVYSIFGTSVHDNGIANGTTLVNAFEEAWQAGCRDIRLMRISGSEATTSLQAEPYTNTEVDVKVEEFIAPGNAAATFTLQHGGIVAETFEVTLDGNVLAAEAYELTTGTAADVGDETIEVKAVLVVNENVGNMGGLLNVSYRYVVEDAAEASEETKEVIASNVDANGAALVLLGEDTEYILNKVPRQGVRVYANGAEVVDLDAFTVTGNILTLHHNTIISRGAHLRVSYSHAVNETVTPTIELRSRFGGAKYNQGTVKVSRDANGIVEIEIVKPQSKKSLMNELPIKVRSVEFPTLQLIANAINAHPYNNCYEASVDSNFALTPTDKLVDKEAVNFSGGSDGVNLSRQGLYEALGGVKDADGFVSAPGAYQVLENYTVDYVVPLGVYADEKLEGIYDNFAYQLALACAVMSHYNSVTLGLISTTTPSSTSLRAIEEHVRKLEALENKFYMRSISGEIIADGEGNQIDLGQFIGIYAGPETTSQNTRLGLVANNSPASIVGTISGLDPKSAPTNKRLEAAQSLRFEYSSAQLNRLIKARYITAVRKPNGDIRIVDAMTAAASDSDYTRFQTARAVKETANQVRAVADPYIGEPNDVQNRNALSAALDKRLGLMVEDGVITNYEFHIISSAQMELIGEAQIELSIKVPNELRQITTIVGLTA